MTNDANSGIVPCRGERNAVEVCDEMGIEARFIVRKWYVPQVVVGVLFLGLAIVAFVANSHIPEAVLWSLTAVFFIGNGVLFLRKRKFPYVKVGGGKVTVLRTEYFAFAIGDDWVFDLDKIERVVKTEKYLLIGIEGDKAVKVYWGFVAAEDRGPLLAFFEKVVG